MSKAAAKAAPKRRPRPRPRPRRSNRRPPGGGAVRRLVILAAGWIFVALGILGMFLPILQGFLFLAVGLVLLSLVSPRMRLVRIKLGARYPKFRKYIERAHAWLRRKLLRD